MKRSMVLNLCAAMALVIGAGGAQADKKDDTLNVAFLDEAATLDSYKVAGREGLIIARHLFDNLLYKDLDTNTIMPALAESYKFVDDLTIEFKLRQDVKFHNGEAFDADDVAYTLNKVVGKDYGTRYRITVDWIKNVEKIDQYTVRIHMAKPFALALEMLAGPLPIYPNEYFESVGADKFSVAPVGTGPYKLIDITPGTRWTLQKFDDHYGASPKGQPAIGKIDVRVLPEPNTQYAELLTGRLDWIWRVPPDQTAKLEQAPNITALGAPVMRIGYIHFNVNAGTEDFPTRKKEVRQAILHATNRQGIADAFVGGASKVVHTACNPAQFGCTQDVVKYDYDPVKAKALLTEAGYPDGFEIELVIAATPRPQAEAMASDLAKVGIKVRINEQQYAAAASKWRAGESPMTFSSWGSYGMGDMALITSSFFGGGADDLVKDNQLSEWLKTGDTATDPEVRKENYAKALKTIAENAYWMSMWNFNVNYAFSSELNFTPHPDEFARWFKASWK